MLDSSALNSGRGWITMRIRPACILLLLMPVFALMTWSASYAESGKDRFRGWDYLVDRLRKEGFSDQRLLSVFGDPRMPRYEDIPFAAAPREHEAMYADFTSPIKIKRGRKCLQDHGPSFRRAEQLFFVPRHVVAAILLIETQCGDFTGKSLIINRLARMASLNNPRNIEKNLKRLRETDPSITHEQLEKRADYLDSIFFPEVAALIRLDEQGKVKIFSLYGSYAGAFGLSQFLPSTFIRYAVDGNRDGIVDLMTIDDAIWSISHFLSAEGWETTSF